MNTIEVIFTEYTNQVNLSHPVWQWDYGQKLLPVGITLPDSYDVHFCNIGDPVTTTETGDRDGVMIPDKYLTSGKGIYAFFYLSDGDESSGATRYEVTIQVIRRPTPD